MAEKLSEILPSGLAYLSLHEKDRYDCKELPLYMLFLKVHEMLTFDFNGLSCHHVPPSMDLRRPRPRLGLETVRTWIHCTPPSCWCGAYRIDYVYDGRGSLCQISQPYIHFRTPVAGHAIGGKRLPLIIPCPKCPHRAPKLALYRHFTETAYSRCIGAKSVHPSWDEVVCWMG